MVYSRQLDFIYFYFIYLKLSVHICTTVDNNSRHFLLSVATADNPSFNRAVRIIVLSAVRFSVDYYRSSKLIILAKNPLAV